MGYPLSLSVAADIAKELHKVDDELIQVRKDHGDPMDRHVAAMEKVAWKDYKSWDDWQKYDDKG